MSEEFRHLTDVFVNSHTSFPISQMPISQMFILHPDFIGTMEGGKNEPAFYSITADRPDRKNKILNSNTIIRPDTLHKILIYRNIMFP